MFRTMRTILKRCCNCRDSFCYGQTKRDELIEKTRIPATERELKFARAYNFRFRMILESSLRISYKAAGETRREKRTDARAREQERVPARALARAPITALRLLFFFFFFFFSPLAMTLTILIRLPQYHVPEACHRRGQ